MNATIFGSYYVDFSSGVFLSSVEKNATIGL